MIHLRQYVYIYVHLDHGWCPQNIAPVFNNTTKRVAQKSFPVNRTITSKRDGQVLCQAENASDMGTRDFIKQATTQSNHRQKEVSRGNVVKPITIEVIVKRVAQHCQCSEQSIYHAQQGKRSSNLPRWITMKLNQDNSGQSLSHIAMQFSVGNYCTASPVDRPIKSTCGSR